MIAVPPAESEALSVPTDTMREISLELPIETPECVQMSFRLAGPAARIGAYLLDSLLRGAIFLIVGIVLLCTGMSLPGMSQGMFLVVWFFLDWFYFAICEGFFNGRTIGKKAVGLRVIENHGYPLSMWSAILRNLCRAADGLSLYGVGFISMLRTRKFQRLGDLAAGTIVIQEKTVRLPTEPIILDTIKPLDRNEFGSYVPPERTLNLIDRLLSRRTNAHQRVPHEKGHALSRELALVLAERMNYSGDAEQIREYSMAFLARVYVTFLREEETDDDAGRTQPVDAIDRTVETLR